MRRHDSSTLEARLRERDRDQLIIGNRVIEANPLFDDGFSQEAEPFEGVEEEASLLQDEQVPAVAYDEAAPQDGGEDELFGALGEALDEIEAEERAETKESMAPTKDVVEIVPRGDTMYKAVTRSFICSTDPLLSGRPRPVVRPGQLVTAVDGELEELLTISLSRARNALERRRACDARRTHRRAG